VTEQLTDTAEKLALATAERAAAQAELVKVQQAVSALEAQETAAIARAQTAVVRQGEIQADRDKIASRLDHLVLWLAAIAGLFVWSGLCQLSGKFQIPPPYSFYGPIAGGALAAAGVAVWLRYFF